MWQQRQLRSSLLRLVEAALGQRNSTAAIRRLRSCREDAADATLSAEHRLLRCRTPLLRGRDTVRTWRTLHEHVRWRGAPPELPAGLLLRRVRLEAELAERCLRGPAAAADPFVGELLAESGLGAAAGLVGLAFSRLSAAMEAARDSPDAAAACLAAAWRRRRRPRSRRTEDRPSCARLSCTLSALAAGSAEASDWLPRLLQLADQYGPAAAALEIG